MAQLLVVYHSRTGGTQALTDAVVAGATSDDIDDVDVHVLGAFDAGPDDVRAANAVVLGTPENFGYMSGAMKDFLERIYYVVLDETPGAYKPIEKVMRAQESLVEIVHTLRQVVCVKG